MAASANFARERAELESILSSGIFDRAPSLALLLAYVCSKYFDGESQHIKEYNIAVEALGRQPDFDPKRDSIVRVEAHRLRKRLREYYAGEGQAHPVQIVIQPGHYAPKFLIRDELVAANGTGEVPAAPANAAPALPAQVPLEFSLVTPWYRRLSWWMVPALALGVLAATVFWPRGEANGKVLPVTADTYPSAGNLEELRILAGREHGTYIDGYGHQWQPDRYFTGGSVFQMRDHTIQGSRDPEIYQNRREGSFGYDIPLKPGTYELRLYFAETLYGEGNTAGGGESSRLFNVSVNGREVFRDLDITGEAGPSTADVKVLNDISPAPDGKLHLRFTGSTGVAFLNGIEITPGVPGGLRQGERFGNLTYSIPVPPGRYRLTLYLAETWFGPNKPGRGGPGSRVFDIFCNGVALARNLDIYKDAGGADRALVHTFPNLQPNPQGKLVISLVPVANYACLNALELTSETSPKR